MPGIRRLAASVVYRLPALSWLWPSRTETADQWNQWLKPGGLFVSYIGGTVGHLLRDAVTMTLTRRHCPSGTVLDIGCAGGSLATHAAGYESYEGVDISVVAIDAARHSEYPIRARFHVSPLEAFSPDGTRDVIVFNEVLYYLPVAEAVTQVRRFAGHLSRDGIVVISLKDAPKSHAIFAALSRTMRWCDGALFQQQSERGGFRMRTDVKRPAYLVGVFRPEADRR